MEPDRKEQVFWLDKWEGKAKDGLYFRSDLVKSIKKAENNNLKVVGIGFDGTWNINLITEVVENEG
jgi:hypothetical protein|tara:strand:+ start:316 stop:513 length:198 start_codon:yes stop_codon:yes gene_type:complete